MAPPAIANALSHDLYRKIIDPEADTRLRPIVARVLPIGIGARALYRIPTDGAAGGPRWTAADSRHIL